MRFTRLHDLNRNPAAAEGFAYGISLHSHTTHSRESLEFIPKYARKSKFLGRVIDLAEGRYTSSTGNVLDWSRAYWTPPLSPRMAVALETDQIERKLRLPAMVSLTDHDNCDAGWETGGPVSVEWTVPCAPSFLHLGVHNLPRGVAQSVLAQMHEYTANPCDQVLRETLAVLSEWPETLIILNHPLWDEGLIGAAVHEQLVERFLRQCNGWIHALELNGLRSAAENDRVCELAVRFDLPVISGGDRHGREPNANLNLTRAHSFAGFVDEVRREKRSEVLSMPQYRDSLRMRQFETAWDILRFDRQRADGRHSWCHRVYHTTEEGVTHPISHYFGSMGPTILLPFLAVMNLLERPAIRPVLRAALGG